MIRFSANLTMLFTDVDFPDRFERAAKAGFKAVEYMFPYPWKKEDLAEHLAKYGLQQVLFNLPAGNWAGGERGLACLPGREGEFREGVGLAIEYAKALGCPLVNCLVGATPADAPPEKVSRTITDNLRFAAAALEKEGLRLLVEPLNRSGRPGILSLRHPQRPEVDRRGRPPESLASVRHLSYAGDGGEPHADDPGEFQPHRPYPDRRQPRAQRTGNGRDQLPEHLSFPG